MSFLSRSVCKLSQLTSRIYNPCSRRLSQFDYNFDPTSDLNEVSVLYSKFLTQSSQVILLGSVNSVSVRNEPRPHAIISLLTKNTYKTAKGYGVKYLSHRVHIFEQPLVQKALEISKSDRICVCGYLTAFPLSDDPKNWYQCVVARLVSRYSDTLEPPNLESSEEELDDVHSILKPEDLI